MLHFYKWLMGHTEDSTLLNTDNSALLHTDNVILLRTDIGTLTHMGNETH